MKLIGAKEASATVACQGLEYKAFAQRQLSLSPVRRFLPFLGVDHLSLWLNST